MKKTAEIVDKYLDTTLHFILFLPDHSPNTNNSMKEKDGNNEHWRWVVEETSYSKIINYLSILQFRDFLKLTKDWMGL
jgi:hypothetical protein